MSPYIFDRPVAGTPVFVGRATLLRNVAVGMAQGRGFVVLGGPKSGRTSVLQELGRRLTENPGGGPMPCVSVYVDLESARGARPHTLYHLIWEAVQRAVLDPHIQAHAAPPRPRKVNLLSAATPGQLLEEALAALWADLAHTPGWCRYSLLLDNADVLTSSAEHEAALQALVQGSEPWRPLAQVLAGGAACQAALARRLGLWKGLRAQSLGVLTEAEAQALLHAGHLDAAELAPDMVASGRHPLVLQCFLDATMRLDGNPQQAWAHASQLLQPSFAAIFAAFPPHLTGRGELSPEHALMQVLLQANRDVTREDVEKVLRPAYIKRAADFLVYHALAERTLRGAVPVLRAGCEPWNTYYAAQLR